MKHLKVFLLSLCTAAAFVATGQFDDPSIIYAVTILPTTAIQRINLMTEEAWATSQLSQENGVQAESFARFMQSQATLGAQLVTPIEDDRKDNMDVRVMWVDFCGEAAEDCTADDYCAGIDSTTPGIDFKDYALTQCITDDFKVSETTFAGSTMDLEDFIASNQRRKIVNMLNTLNTKTLLFLHANAGINRGLQPGGRTFNVNNQTEVIASEYTTDLITDMIIDAQISQITNPYVLDGRNLMKPFLNARLDDNAGAPGAQRRAGYFDVTFDPFGFAKAGVAIANSTFMVSPYAGAFVNKSFYNNAVPQREIAGGKDVEKYTITLPAFGVRVDVLHQRICESLKKNRFAHVWKYTLHYDFLSNPFGCPDANGDKATGILEYTKVANPA